jgi:PTS system nitrogen regulatory IIA component
MQLSVREAAQLLNVPENTVYRWIQKGELPATKIHDQYRLNRAELLEWATSQRISVSADIFRDADHAAAPAGGLAEALRAGGIHWNVPGADKLSVLSAVVELMPLSEEVDRQFLLQLLLARESLGSTGLGNGIAVPHARNPIVMHIPHPMVTLCFLEHPIDFVAVDGLPVHTLFAIVSPTVKSHLQVLSRLAFGLRHPGFAEVLGRRGAADEILTAALSVDQSVLSPKPAT